MITGRKYIRAYFTTFNWRLFGGTIFVFLFISYTRRFLLGYFGILGAVIGVVAIVLPILYLIKYFLGTSMACQDSVYDENYKEDILKMKKILHEKMNLNREEVLNQFEILVYKNKPNSISFKEFILGTKPPFILKKKGVDNKIRRTPVIFQNIICLEDKLMVGITTLDILTGNLLNTNIQNIYFNEVTIYYFQDETYVGKNWFWIIDALKEKISKNNSINQSFIVQQDIEQVNTASKFIIQTRGGKSIEIELPISKFIDNVDDEKIHKSTAQNTILAIQKLLDDKKQETT